MTDIDPATMRRILVASRTVPPPAEGEPAGETCPGCGAAPTWRYHGRPVARIDLNCTCGPPGQRPITIRPPRRPGQMRPLFDELGDEE